jgi:Cdc6-like AAA superfamily ATPase
MSHPKDWFRRRRSQTPAGTGGADPFAGETVLDLGQSAAILLGGVRLDKETTVDQPATVPPPPTRPHREGTRIDRSAFLVRPELVRSEAPRADAASRSASPPGSFWRGTAIRVAPQPAVTETAPPKAEARPPKAEARPAKADARPAKTDATATKTEDEASFTLAAPGASWRRNRPGLAENGGITTLLREAFTPTRPKQSNALFAGRFKQLQRIIAAIEEERAHIMVYGERGSGKTSLANVLAAKAEEAGYVVTRFACSAELVFEDIFRGFLRRLPASLLSDGIGATSRAGIDHLEQLLPGRCGVGELINIFERVRDKHLVLIIDEYDRVTDEDTKSRLAELIKTMSDTAAPVTLLIVGVAENVSQLLGKHPSLQRTLVTVPMPLMTRREIEGIIAAGEEKLGLTFDAWTRQAIAEFAQGLPYHVQLLCLLSARSAARRQSKHVEREDFRYAVQHAGEEAEAHTKEAYDLAVGPQENASFRDVLFYAARCRTDAFGTFSVAEVVQAQTGGDALSLLALQYPLKKLTEPERGALLRRIVGPSGLRYQFGSQQLRFHVLCRQAEQRGLI